jgi:dynein heavy chain
MCASFPRLGVECKDCAWQDIDTTRSEYVPVAYRSSLLYFCVADLSTIDPMYQYSLGWFMGLFRLGIQNSTPSEDLQERLTNIIDYFTFSVYQNVCRSLFEKHKLLLSLLLCVRIMQGDNKIDSEEFKFLLSGPPTTKIDGDNPAPDWMTINTWTEFSNMHFDLAAFRGVTDVVREHSESFKQMFDAAAPEDFELPGGLQDSLSKFQRLLILRAMRLDKVTEGVQLLVASELGNPFIEPPPFNLQLCYADSTARTPLIFVFTPGSDPASDLYAFADVMKMNRKLEAISLGQGQGPIAENLITNGQDSGGWVFLQVSAGILHPTRIQSQPS